jgi:hypothetical protein
MYPKPDPNAVKPDEKITQLLRKSSAGPPTLEQPPRPSSASSNPKGLPLPPTGANGEPRHVPEEDSDGEGSAKLCKIRGAWCFC